ncbi:MAG: protein O-mannosyl-transferase family [Bacteroidota bacterium]
MDFRSYKAVNNLLGWLMFLAATTVFMLTLEPTASFWDAGERLSAAYKLQVMHPPGAPLYQMMARMFSLLAMGDVTRVAYWINAMSAVAGGLSVMFLFWTIGMLGHRILKATGEPFSAKTWAVWGAGIVGGLTLTFSDSFWFTAVEAEVYITSLFLTTFVFWSILKWEATEHEPDSLKWLVLIAFIIGLSIGVHMLNLLALPAIVFVYYFKKFKSTPRGIIITGIVAVLLLGFLQNVFIPGVLTLDWWFERFFVNSLGLPFHTGTLFYFIFIISLIIFGLYYTHKKNKVILNTIILAVMFILIGYTSFLMLVVRSNAHVPINENAPQDALSLKAYLGREQYGSWPLLHGPYYNAPVVDIEDGNPVWRKDEEAGKYVISNRNLGTVPVYNPEFTTIFPRMWSNRSHHVRAYESWGKVEGRPVRVERRDGSIETINKPTFAENLRFFFSYQLGHMYMRYLMWNFSGRQNDLQGHGEPHRGNWMTGIKPLDEVFLGPQDNLPESIASNRGHSKYLLLPFILGIIGLVYQAKRKPDDAIVTGLLFFMTGIAIIIYLNQWPFQPRERDYSYIGSFYAFSIWVGLGTLAFIEFLQKKLGGKYSAIAGTALCVLLVPTIMAAENWNNHDRSNRYLTRDVAINYLESCAPNAIIFTMGDNDTFPLWYAQEVEGVRTDIKVVNLSLLSTDWYIDGMMRRKFYEAEPVPFSLEPDQYKDGTRDFLYFREDPRLEDQYINLSSIINFISNDNNRIRVGNTMENYFPTRNFRLPVDSATVVNNGTVAPEDADLIVDAVEWTFPNTGGGIYKNNLMVLDFLAANNWERPVYFAITTGSEAYIGLEDYFQLEGMAYRLVPVKTTRSPEGFTGRINTDILYNNIMNKFQWGNIDDPAVYLSEDHRRLTVNFRSIIYRLANALVDEGKHEKAIEVLDYAEQIIPMDNVPPDYFNMMMGETYYRAGAFEKGNEIFEKIISWEEQNLAWYFSFPERRIRVMEGSMQESLGIIQRINHVSDQQEQTEMAELSGDIFDHYYQLYTNIF